MLTEINKQTNKQTYDEQLVDSSAFVMQLKKLDLC